MRTRPRPDSCNALGPRLGPPGGRSSRWPGPGQLVAEEQQATDAGTREETGCCAADVAEAGGRIHRRRAYRCVSPSVTQYSRHGGCEHRRAIVHGRGGPIQPDYHKRATRPDQFGESGQRWPERHVMERGDRGHEVEIVLSKAGRHHIALYGGDVAVRGQSGRRGCEGSIVRIDPNDLPTSLGQLREQQSLPAADVKRSAARRVCEARRDGVIRDVVVPGRLSVHAQTASLPCSRRGGAPAAKRGPGRAARGRPDPGELLNQRGRLRPRASAALARPRGRRPRTARLRAVHHIGVRHRTTYDRAAGRANGLPLAAQVVLRNYLNS